MGSTASDLYWRHDRAEVDAVSTRSGPQLEVWAVADDTAPVELVYGHVHITLDATAATDLMLAITDALASTHSPPVEPR